MLLLISSQRTQHHPNLNKSLVVKTGMEKLASISPSIVSVQLHYSLIRSLCTHFLWHGRTSTCAAVRSIKRANGYLEVHNYPASVLVPVPLRSRDNLLISFSYEEHPPPTPTSSWKELICLSIMSSSRPTLPLASSQSRYQCRQRKQANPNWNLHIQMKSATPHWKGFICR